MTFFSVNTSLKYIWSCFFSLPEDFPSHLYQSNSILQNTYVHSKASERDLTWKEGFCRCNLQGISRWNHPGLSVNLDANDWHPYTKVWGPLELYWEECPMKTEAEIGPTQLWAKEHQRLPIITGSQEACTDFPSKSPERSKPAGTLISYFCLLNYGRTNFCCLNDPLWGNLFSNLEKLIYHLNPLSFCPVIKIFLNAIFFPSEFFLPQGKFGHRHDTEERWYEDTGRRWPSIS